MRRRETTNLRRGGGNEARGEPGDEEFEGEAAVMSDARPKVAWSAIVGEGSWARCERAWYTRRRRSGNREQ